jgi:excinuclease UvrABC ATPase subunit
MKRKVRCSEIFFENRLDKDPHIVVEIPLNLFVCMTGASGSGKSTLVNEVLFKKLYSLFYDSRVLSGDLHRFL